MVDMALHTVIEDGTSFYIFFRFPFSRHSKWVCNTHLLYARRWLYCYTLWRLLFCSICADIQHTSPHSNGSMSIRALNTTSNDRLPYYTSVMIWPSFHKFDFGRLILWLCFRFLISSRCFEFLWFFFCFYYRNSCSFQ